MQFDREAHAPRVGRHFLQILGPSNAPDRTVRVIDCSVVYHCGPESAKLATAVLRRPKSVFKTMNPIGDLSGVRRRRLGAAVRGLPCRHGDVQAALDSLGKPMRQRRIEGLILGKTGQG